MAALSNLVIIAILLICCSSPALARSSTLELERVCKEKKEFIELSRKAQITWDQLIADSALGTDVMLIGVEHWNFETEIYPDLVRRVQHSNPSTNCFLVEAAVDPKSSKARILSEINNGDLQVYSDSEAISTMGSDWLRTLKEIRSLGVKVFYVDQPGADSADLETAEQQLKWLNDRDAYMASRIHQLISSGECKGAVYPVGLAHLIKQEGRTSLSFRLEKRFSTGKLLLIIAGRNSYPEAPMYGLSWTWQRSTVPNIDPTSNLLCSSTPAIPESGFAFFNHQSAVPVAWIGEVDRSGFYGSYGEFKGTLVHVCPKNTTCGAENSMLRGVLKSKRMDY